MFKDGDKNDVSSTELDTKLVDTIDSGNLHWEFVKEQILEDARLGIQSFESLKYSLIPKRYEPLARKKIGGLILENFNKCFIPIPINETLNQLHSNFKNNNTIDEDGCHTTKEFYDTTLESQSVD